MNIKQATRDFEKWLAGHTPIVTRDVRLKHARMKADRFEFLRATYYRWAQLFPEQCAALQKAPVVLAVGDLHVENFGTWRDAEGRLIWGVNDFDEAYRLPYANDLVRLAVSIRMAIKAGHLELPPEGACEQLLGGYREGLERGGNPFALAEGHPKLWAMATARLKEPHLFWRHMEAGATEKRKLPSGARKIVEESFPAPGLKYEVFRRVAGRGSLGKTRLVALGMWAGGRVAREAKVLTPSACAWAMGEKDSPIHYSTIVRQAVRCPDPFLHVSEDWVVRRLAPDCAKIEMAELGTADGSSRLIRAMGVETANVHLGTKGAAAAILRDLKRRDSGWLIEAARAMMKATREDWEAWRA